jgi:GAF domain-containing protein
VTDQQQDTGGADWGADSRRNLAEVLGALAIELQAQTEIGATLHSIVEASVELVPGAGCAGISLIEGKRVTPSVPTDELVAELDSLQNELGQGPCLDALREHRTVRIDDTSTDTRWPRYGHAASERGVRSVLCFQLFVQDENLGALNLYGDDPHVFTDESELIGGVLAQHAAVAMVGAQETKQFESALASRDVIGQAKGILMCRENLTGFAAFNLLTRASQSVNMKVATVARRVGDDHETGLTRNTRPRQDD